MLSTDVFLDIFFEVESFERGEYDYYRYPYDYSNYSDTSRLSEIFKKFRRCLQYNTRYDVSCHLARLHYLDIRYNNIQEDDMEDNKINILWIRGKIKNLLTNRDIKHSISSFKLLLKKYPKITTLLKELVQDDIKKVCEFMKKQLEDESYIKKELGKIEDKELKRSILTFFGDLISKEITIIMPSIKQSVINTLNYDKISEYELFKSMTLLDSYFGTTMSYFTDVYLLGRMFKIFDISEMEKAYEGAVDDQHRQPNRANNIIIYCGDNHAKNYRNFLESIGFNEIDHTGDLKEDILKPIPKTPKNCVDMRKIKQPFFSYKRYDDNFILGNTKRKNKNSHSMI